MPFPQTELQIEYVLSLEEVEEGLRVAEGIRKRRLFERGLLPPVFIGVLGLLCAVAFMAGGRPLPGILLFLLCILLAMAVQFLPLRQRLWAARHLMTDQPAILRFAGEGFTYTCMEEHWQSPFADTVLLQGEQVWVLYNPHNRGRATLPMRALPEADRLALFRCLGATEPPGERG